MITHLTVDNFESEVLSSTVPVLVDFWAPWCGPCRAIAPRLDEASEELGDTAKVCKVNIDEATSLSEMYSIRAIPTLLLFKNGNIVNTKVGNVSKDDIINLVNAALND